MTKIGTLVTHYIKQHFVLCSHVDVGVILLDGTYSIAKVVFCGQFSNVTKLSYTAELSDGLLSNNTECLSFLKCLLS